MKHHIAIKSILLVPLQNNRTVMNTVIYIRVPTSVQDYQLLIDEHQQFASSHGWNVLQVFSEKLSRKKKE